MELLAALAGEAARNNDVFAFNFYKGQIAALHRGKRTWWYVRRPATLEYVPCEGPGDLRAMIEFCNAVARGEASCKLEVGVDAAGGYVEVPPGYFLCERDAREKPPHETGWSVE
jgi:hypothetical protein